MPTAEFPDAPEPSSEHPEPIVPKLDPRTPRSFLELVRPLQTALNKLITPGDSAVQFPGSNSAAIANNLAYDMGLLADQRKITPAGKTMFLALLEQRHRLHETGVAIDRSSTALMTDTLYVILRLAFNDALTGRARLRELRRRGRTMKAKRRS